MAPKTNYWHSEGTQVCVFYQLGIPAKTTSFVVHTKVILLTNLTHVLRDRDQLDDAFDAELLSDNQGGLLSDDECSAVRVRTNVSRCDGQVGDFESAYTIHIQIRVDNAAPLARLHGARTELTRNCKRKNK